MIRHVLTLFVLFVFGSAFSQNIAVTVDGRQVMFQGQGPAMVQGRVMVPLRGVLEAMGAYVEYRSATRSVFARRGATELELRLGERAAMVDGSQVMLDVPAMSMGGSTMVPLRFMGESLGADVRWIDSTRTVMISTSGISGGGGGSGSGAGAGPVSIQAFTHSANEWIRPGETINVTLVGTPGMQANFGISGVTERVPMRETASGRYEGSWTAPANRQIGISGASIIGTLQSTTDSRSIQAATNVSIDTLAPKITQVLPEANAQVVQGDVSVSAVFDDGGGSGVDSNTVRILVNGQDVTRDATVTTAFANLRTNRVVVGRNIAVVSLSDMAGNQVIRTWEFVVAATSTVVKALTHDATGVVQAGEVINVRLEGAANGRATFSVGANADMQMSEGPAGVYTGRYTVRRGENLANAPVTAKLVVSGQTFSIEAKNRVSASFDGGALEPPTLTSPTGTTVLSPIKVAGKTIPSIQVKVKVEYETTVLGALRMTGTIFQDTLRADSAGKFETKDIELSTSIGGSDTVYKVTVIAILDSGKESSPRVVTLRLR